MPLGTASVSKRRGLGITGALTAVGLALGALTMTPVHAAETAGASAQASKVAAAKGKVVNISGKMPGCRVHAVVSASKKTASGYLRSSCKYGSAHVLAGMLTIDNQKTKTVTKRQRTGKMAETKTIKLSNPKGTQKICMVGSWNHPLGPAPQQRSEARACVKY
ncbi:hypothetical protein HCJ93_11825 [Streptomyces sp. SBST2-5]|uniref:Secreted protein n=1 Tax=Streptomyces composti TaxID=2720025 RepID=A0ABX1A812_9ACTN|nr:hypothetical protein [Streptomyces composti]NJP50739.1 hypothetical protein [Streptomyces composti]